MPTEHRNIPDTERHEPKGISTATVGQVYRSSGSASGAWKDDVITLSAVLNDVSDPSFILIPITVDCSLLSVKAVLKNAITVADATLTITRGGDDVVMGTMTIPFTGSEEGFSINITSFSEAELIANTNPYIKIATDGASTTTSILYINVKAKVVE